MPPRCAAFGHGICRSSCANPDIVVERGDRLIWCAGSLARDYALLGGRTFISGKAAPADLRASLKAAGQILGREIAKGDVLAIGDGMLTDVKGAPTTTASTCSTFRVESTPGNMATWTIPTRKRSLHSWRRNGRQARRRHPATEIGSAMTARPFQHLPGGTPLPPELRGGVVAIGNFDASIAAIRRCSKRAREEAERRGAPALVLTFEPHPRTVFRRRCRCS